MAYKSLIANSGNLSDYESSTFTPVLQGSGTAGTPTYATQVGQYTRFGRICVVRIFFNISAFAGATGTLQVSGLPFTSANVTGLVQCFGTRAGSLTYSGIDNILQAKIEPNTTVIDIMSTTNAGIENGVPIDTSFFINIDGAYIIEV